MSLQNLSSFLHNRLMPEVTSYLLWRLLCLETFRDKVDTPDIIAICILFYCSYSCIQILIGDGHFLNWVPPPTLLDLDDLSVSWKLVGDLPHSRHADIGKLYGEVSVLISHDPLTWSRCQCGILQVLGLVLIAGRERKSQRGIYLGCQCFLLNTFYAIFFPFKTDNNKAVYSSHLAADPRNLKRRKVRKCSSLGEKISGLTSATRPKSSLIRRSDNSFDLQRKDKE